MKLKRIFFILVLIFFVASCGDQAQEPNEKQNDIDINRVWSKEDYELFEKEREFDLDEKYAEARALNDKGVMLLQMSYGYPKGSPEKDSLMNEALLNLNKAIEKQKDYYYSYFNKAEILREMGQYDAALRLLEELLQIKEDDPGAFLTMGWIYEKKGNKEMAHQQYQKALNAYEELLKTPMATLQDSIDKDMVLLFIEGKEKALDKINNRVKKDPQNVDLLMTKQMIEQFDREKHFKDF